MIWKFTLNGIEIDEPMGMDDFSIMVQRDEQWHGIFIEASVSQLTFYGDAYTILKTAKESCGVDAVVAFVASVKCEGESEFTEALTGRLNFGSYRETCGNECMISMNIEKDTCAMTFKNRFDQKVNLDSNLAFNKTTLLPDYNGLSFNLQLATQVIPIGADGDVSLEGDVNDITDPPGYGDTYFSIRPVYDRVTDSSITTTSLEDPLTLYNIFAPITGQQLTGQITPQVLIEEPDSCINQEWTYHVRMKGTFEQTLANGDAFRVAFGYWDGVGNIIDNLVPIEPFVLYNGPIFTGGEYPFDNSFSGTVTLPDGVGVYALVQNYVTGGGVQHGRIVTFDPETSFLLTNDRTCPPTNCEVYLVNEALARVTEALTDSCLTVKSDYYGRTDSQPYHSSADGCGGLRILTNGLKIRQAEDKLFFASMEEIMNGLRSIDNIGMGMEPNSEVGSGEWLRVEPARYFYQPVKILDLPFIPQSSSELQEPLVYSNIAYGYNNWEIKSIKGIDEVNSYKERRTSISTVNNKLDITTDIIAGGYIIENLRLTTLASSGETDSTYDNDVFTICVTRDCLYAASFIAISNKMFLVVNGDGSQFVGLASITIAGTISNNGARAIDNVAVINLPGGISDVIMEFSGGATIDEYSETVTFSGISFVGLCVEQGIISSPANIYSSTTVYNWRIRPLYNLMRWFKSIAQCYVNLSNTTSKLFFTFGKGNYLAEGRITTPDLCALENKVMAESQDLSKNDFIDPTDYMPIFKPEIITFDYPLSVADYLLIKAAPYGYLNIQCGIGNYEKAFIKTIEYKPSKGSATFTLLKSWQ